MTIPLAIVLVMFAWPGVVMRILSSCWRYGQVVFGEANNLRITVQLNQVNYFAILSLITNNRIIVRCCV